MTLLLALIFSGMLLFSFAVIFFFTGPRTAERRIQGRIATIRSPSTDLSGQQPSVTGMVQENLSSRIEGQLQGYRFTKKLNELIRHAGSERSAGSVLASSVALAVAGGTIVRLVFGPLPLTALAAALGGGTRWAILRFQSAKRLKQFDTALPDAIELMARALRAGHSMAASIEIVAEQSPKPLAGEFALCFQQQKFGIPLRDALLAMGERVPSQDLHFLITAVLVQKETGGDLTDILDRATLVIRDRVRIQGEVRTYTAQGRLTGWILSLLPIAMLGLINIVSPGYSHILFHDPLGQKLLYAGGTLILIGGVIIGKIVHIKI